MIHAITGGKSSRSDLGNAAGPPDCAARAPISAWRNTVAARGVGASQFGLVLHLGSGQLTGPKHAARQRRLETDRGVALVELAVLQCVGLAPQAAAELGRLQLRVRLFLVVRAVHVTC